MSSPGREDSLLGSTSAFSFTFVMSIEIVTLALLCIGRLCVIVSTLAPRSDRHFSSPDSTPGSWSSIIENTAFREPVRSFGSKI